MLAVVGALLLLAGVASVAAFHHSHHSSKLIPNVFAVHMKESVSCQKVMGAALAAAGCKVVFRTNVQTKLASMCSYEIMNSCDHTAAVSQEDGFVSSFPVSRIQRPALVQASALPSFHPHVDVIHNITGVLDARNKLGLTGDGIKVAVIDTGIYYLHPALGGGFGPGFKVAFGYDLVGDNFDGTTSFTIVPDKDPIDNCSGESHGTHVAGIVAANATGISKPGFVASLPFTGVAPGVTLGAYRVFGCKGNTGDDIVAAAMLRAVNDGADVINLSLAGSGYSDNVEAVYAIVASKTGHIVVAANGNNGLAGAYVADKPGLSAGGLGVASMDNVHMPSLELLVNDISYPYTVVNNGNFTFNKPFAEQFVVNNPNAIEFGVLDDGCRNITVDVKGKAVLFYFAGGCDFFDRPCYNAVAAGASACIFYYKSDDLSQYGGSISGSKVIPSLITTLTAGKRIIADVATNKHPIVVPTKNYFNAPSLTGGTVSSFSSPGLTNELLLKPDLGGIGGNVLSTISPFAAQSQELPSAYAVYSGTSMSSPYVAGCMALLLQKRGKIGFDAARAYLQNTATLTNVYNTSLIHSPAYQGAGLVNIYKAATTNTLVIPSSLSLNDTANRKRGQTLRISNNAVGPITYFLSHEPAAAVHTSNAGDDFFLDRKTTTFDTKYVATVKFGGAIMKGQAGKSVKGETEERNKGTTTKDGQREEGGKKADKIKSERQGSSDKTHKERRLGSSKYSVTIKSGESATIPLDFKAPVPASADLWPLFGGYIVITNSLDVISTRVPYAGVAGVWKDRDIWARNSTSLYTRWGLENPSGPVGIFGLRPGSVAAGVYANATFTPLTKLDVVNVTNAKILATAASDSRSAIVTITDLCSKDTELKALGLPRTNFLGIFDLTSYYTQRIPLRISFAYGEKFRNTYSDTLNGVSAPHVYSIDGTVVTNINLSATAILPAGVYEVKFVAWKNFGNASEVDVVTTPPFQLVYTSPLPKQILANCKV